MQNRSPLLVIFVFSLCILHFSCRKECSPTEVQTDEIGDEFFTVEYRDFNGANYLNSIYNTANVGVFLDTTGGAFGNASFRVINPAFQDGKFGPFYYTKEFIQESSGTVNEAVLLRQFFNYNYYIRKDTYGTDTLTVSFFRETNDCSNFWGYIRFNLNGRPLAAYEGQEQAEIVITE